MMNILEKEALKVCFGVLLYGVRSKTESKDSKSLKKAIEKAEVLNTLLMKDIANNCISMSVKIKIVQRLQELLTHKNYLLVQAVTLILIQCVEHNELIDEVSLHIMSFMCSLCHYKPHVC